MSRLFRSIVLLILVAIVIAFAPRLAGGTHPVSSLKAVLTMPDGRPCIRPCLFGIRPGVTDGKQAALILRSHPLTQNGTWLNDRDLRLDGPEAYVTFSLTNEGLVDSITLTASLADTGLGPAGGSLLDSITLGDYLLLFSVTRAYIVPSNYLFVLDPTDGTTASVVLPVNFMDRIQADIPLAQIMVSVVRACPGSGVIIYGRDWAGLTRFSQYADGSDLYNTGKRQKLLFRPSGLFMPPYVVCYP